jgi:hypothetical protein
MRREFLPMLLLLAPLAPGQEFPTTRPADGKLPHIQVDLQKKQVRLECEAVVADAPLEFLVCLTGTKEYESLLRSQAKPSHLHLALLMIGVKPGKPVRFDERLNKMLPPEGARLKLTCEFEREGKNVSLAACRLMRNEKSKQEMPPVPWVFSGSQFTQDGDYFADISGEIISVVNFPHTVLDVPMVRSDKNESLEWVPNPELAPARNTKVWLVIEPADATEGAK